MFKKISSKIPHHVKLLLKLYASSLILFFLIRLLFYFINKSTDVDSVIFSEKLMAFKRGLEFDTVVFCWIGFLPVLVWSIAYLTKYNRLYFIGYYVFLVLQLVYLFVLCANIPYFHQFGSHLNKSAFLWNESPVFAAGIIFGSFSYWGYLILFSILAFVLVKFSQHQLIIFKAQLQNQKPIAWYYKVLITLLLATVSILGARGRIFDRSPLQEGFAIVSQNGFINQVAINPNYTFWRTIFYSKKKKQYTVPKNIDEQIAFTRAYLNIQTPYKRSISREVNELISSKTAYNVIVVLMESMSVYKMGYYGGKNLTPNLHKLNKESIFCENFFSSGMHTFNGLFSTTAGFPSIFDEKSMRSYVKQPFNGLGPLLSQKGYETYFYTTHDPQFDNMEGFFKLNNFEHGISEYNFNFSQTESSLGVPDHLLFDKLIETVNSRKSNKPFLSVLMTASDHGPWKIPGNIPYKPNGETPQENCTLYADWSIGKFMNDVKKLPWYNNTVFIFLGDHGLSTGNTYEMSLSYNHIPCIIHQPNLFKTDTISSPCYQPDIPATVMGIVGGNYTNNTFGINILKEEHPFVVFSADDKIGCVDNNGYYYYKTLSNGETYLRKYKQLDPINYKNELLHKADSMNKNMMSVYESANYFIRNKYFLYD